MYCWRCGEFNAEEFERCTKCDAELRAVDIACPAEEMSTIVPYKNPNALTAYYLGVFSLIPGLGLLLGVGAIVLGITGLNYYNLYPRAKGKVHAWVGIVLGGLSAVAHIGFGVWLFISAGSY